MEENKMGKGRTFSTEFKSKVALEAIRGDQSVAEIASKFKVHPTQITQWKKQALSQIPEAFNGKAGRKKIGEDNTVGLLHNCTINHKVGKNFQKSVIFNQKGDVFHRFFSVLG